MAKEKLTPIPNPKGPKKKRDQSANACENIPNPNPPDLSHITESLRPLAVPTVDLVFDPANPMTHDERNIDAIKASLQVYGQRKPIVVRREGNVVIAGNGTLQAGLALSWSHIAAVYVDDDAATAAGYSIADNRTAQLAEWDKEALQKLMTEIKLDEDPRLQQMMSELAQDLGLGESSAKQGQTDPDDIPAPPDVAITQPGHLILLGKHRLLCGDSGKGEDVDRLLDGAKIQLVNTDPPYNVRVEPRSNNAIAAGLSSFEATSGKKKGIASADTAGMHHQGFDLARDATKAKGTTKKMRPKDRPLANDFVSEEMFDQMLHAWFGNMSRVLEPGRGFYIWGGYANCGNYPPVLKACELYFSQAIIWVKEHAVLTRKDFMGNHEWCFYGWREGAAHHWYGPTNAQDVWPVKKINPQSMIHLREKPVELARRAIDYSSRPGENVLDLFGGSGSTLMAAEQTGRQAFLMELDPLYCDVIVKRWEDFTGQKAVRPG